MRGKFDKKKKNANHKHWMRAALILLLAAVAVCVLLLLRPDLLPDGNGTEPADSTAPSFQLDETQGAVIDLGDGLVVTEVGAYTGMYVEDGSNEIVSGVLMLVVKNTSDEPLQYAQIHLEAGDQTANFALSTLPAGESMVVLEQERMAYDQSLEYTAAVSEYVAWFAAPLSLCEDRLKIQALDGAMNITNISGEDISGDIIVYFKNVSAGMLYGGITYRVRITNGLKAGEVRQIFSEHYTVDGSTVMFVTCG